MAEWFKVAGGGTLADGQARVVEVNGRSIALFKTGGRMYATDSACAHRGGPLAEGTIEADSIVCPWHGFRFDLKEGACSTNPALRLACYPARLAGDDVEVEM
ncbi:MAG TPA: Rieske 2Fe-2S domain-containing protein [Candidatus Polarisedimenticolia bacterium]|nr:Rieske 2Fe-2S domain-containing protein [Candidatus Polarisedimenticolia bacterium]